MRKNVKQAEGISGTAQAQIFISIILHMNIVMFRVLKKETFNIIN